MSSPFSAVKPSAKLSDQVASALEAEIRAGRIQAAQKLPTEAVLAQQFQVSRTVVREAISRLKSLGLVDSRQGSGVYVHMTSTSGLIGNFGQANYSAAKLGIAALSKSIALDMQKFGVRSNCISPFAWSRMIGSIPTETPEEQARVARLTQMTPAKIAPLAVCLASDAASDVNGQIFAVRNNEIFLMSQPRPVRSVHRSEGWTPQSVAAHALPALKARWCSVGVMCPPTPPCPCRPPSRPRNR